MNTLVFCIERREERIEVEFLLLVSVSGSVTSAVPGEDKNVELEISIVLVTTYYTLDQIKRL